VRFLVNDQEVNFPTSLSEITLGQRVQYYNQYGKELDEMLTAILQIKDEEERELELVQLQLEKMFTNVAFFAGTTPDALKESDFLDAVANIYYSCTKILMEDEASLELKTEYVWNSEVWEIHPPELKHGSPMKFGEFIDAKQIIKDMMDLGKGRWESLVSLCAIYLRRKDEPYKEEFMYEGSERQELMLSLPMDIALAVGFFLSGSMNILMNIFQSSGSLQASQASMQRSTLIAGVG
jgi:hypothetical protein